MSKKRQAKRRAKAKARARGRAQLADPGSSRSRLAAMRAEMEQRRAALKAAEFSPEVKATLRACPELIVFERDIPGFGICSIGMEDILEPADLETFYTRFHPELDEEAAE